MYTILIVDDEAKLREVLAMAVEGMGHDCLTAGSGEEALRLMNENRVHLVLCDLRMPQMSGKSLLEIIKAQRPELPVIIMTAFAALKDAVELIKNGAFDYLSKPFDLDVLEATVTSALRYYALGNDNAALRRELENTPGPGRMIGESEALLTVCQRINEVSASNANVLITGESGTGKELAARAVHDNSARKQQPFVTINCAAIHESLLESELFGHVKGAFTGASFNRAGRFAQADGGTLFLDEIGDMPLALQAKILRVLQDRIIEPVGGQSGRKVDVRIIAATNQNLEQAIAEGRFRSDLFFRLNVFPMVMPALRDRTGDIPLLATYFADRFASELGKKAVQLTADALNNMQIYPWPGNIRELQNFMERLTISHAGKQVTKDMVAGWLCEIRAFETPETATCTGATEAVHLRFPLDLEARLADVEQQIISAALRETGGVQAKAAVLLNISERSIWHRIKKLGIEVAK